MKLWHAAILVTLAAFLFGCGDGGSSTPAPTAANGEKPATVPSAPGGKGTGGGLDASAPDPNVGYNPNASSGVQVGEKAGGK